MKYIKSPISASEARENTIEKSPTIYNQIAKQTALGNFELYCLDGPYIRLNSELAKELENQGYILHNDESSDPFITVISWR